MPNIEPQLKTQTEAVDRSRATRARVAAAGGLAVGGTGLLTVGLLTVAGPVSGAGSFVVSNLNDSGAGSLREAVTDAIVASGGAITFDPALSGTLTLASALPPITSAVEITITGPGDNGDRAVDAGEISISGDNSHELIKISNGGSLSISGLQFVKGSEQDGQGGAIEVNRGTLNVSNMTFADGSAFFAGGALHADDSTVTITDTVFLRSQAGYGGAIRARDTALTVTDSTFYNTYSALEGGSIVIESRNAGKSSTSISGSTFRLSQSRGSSGGAIFVGVRKATTIEIRDSSFISNRAYINGGAIAVSVVNHLEPLTLTISDSLFDGNTSGNTSGYNSGSGSSGGAIFLSAVYSSAPNLTTGDFNSPTNDVTISDTQFIANTAKYYGGAISAKRGADLTISSSMFRRNSTLVEDGGAVYLRDGKMTVTSTYFVENSAYASGGAISLRNSVLDLDDLRLEGNSAGSHGGAIRATKSNVTISHSVLESNAAAGYGGGVRASSSHRFDIVDSELVNNRAVYSGGAVSIDQSYDAMVIDGSTISGNSASAAGGGIHAELDRFDLRVVNTTIEANTATEGGAMWMYAPATLGATVEFSTVVGNTATDPGSVGGLANASRGSLSISHSVISGNAGGSATPDADVVNSGGGDVTASWSLIGDGDVTDGGNNLAAGTDPKLGALAGNGGPTRTMMPALDSPLRDAGDPSVAGAPSTDQRGETRPFNNVVDIGAVEIVESDIPTTTTPPPPATTTSTTTSTAAPEPGPAVSTVLALPEGGEISDETVEPGRSVTMSGEGFAAGEKVQVLFVGDEVRIVATVLADAQGRAQSSVLVPVDALGESTIALYGVDSGVGVRRTIEVVAPLGDPVTLPATGSDGLATTAGLLLLSAGGLVALTSRRRRTA